jgi:hypothetical protein
MSLRPSDIRTIAFAHEHDRERQRMVSGNSENLSADVGPRRMGHTKDKPELSQEVPAPHARVHAKADTHGGRRCARHGVARLS